MTGCPAAPSGRLPEAAQNSAEARPNRARPFVKWAGGKKQLIPRIARYYPFDERVVKYAEPFVGGGAVLFDVLARCRLEAVYISDVNEELIAAYKAVRDDPEELSHALEALEKRYLPLDQSARRVFYDEKKARFNELKKIRRGRRRSLEKAALFMFLNRTCFNGLYRENSRGEFNVPAGAYACPRFASRREISAASAVLQGVEIVHGDYQKAASFIDERTFAYFDPPYRPLCHTSRFNSYSRERFTDADQRRLAGFVEKMHEKGAKIIVSSSDPKNVDPADDFFDEIYAGRFIERVPANRRISRSAGGRGEVSELIISNFIPR